MKKIGNSTMLICQNIIDCKQYHNKDCAITWKECSLRKWLNSDFINTAFSKDEQRALLSTELENGAGNISNDKVFYLVMKNILYTVTS